MLTKAENKKKWFESNTLALFLCLLTSLPVMVTSLPPLVDYYGHIGRYHVQLNLEESPLLQKNWDFEWALIPNLGVDLLIIPLASIFGLERAAWLIALLIPPLMAFGFLRISKAVHGKISASFIAAVPFALAYPFQFGFINYWLGVAFVMHAFAYWLIIPPKNQLKSFQFVLISLIIWITHVYAWGILLLLIVGSEIARTWESGEKKFTYFFILPIQRCWSLLTPLPFMLIWRSAGEAKTDIWFSVLGKFIAIIQLLRDQWFPLDIASVIAVLLLLYFAIRSEKFSFTAKLAIPNILMLITAIIMPHILAGSYYADDRIWPVLFSLSILAINIKTKNGQRIANGVALAALAFFIARISVSTVGFYFHSKEVDEKLNIIEKIDPGSKVVVFVSQCNHKWRKDRLNHIGSIAIERRDAFTNTQWAASNAQLIIPLGGIDTPFNSDPSHYIYSKNCDDIQNKLYKKIDLIPRNRFDYLWLIDFEVESLEFKDLELISSDKKTALYKIQGL